MSQFLSMVRDCPPFQSFMLGYSGSALGFGIMYSVIIVALSSYFKIASQIALFLLVMTVLQVVAIPAWASLAQRFSKHAIWGWAWAAHAAIAPAILLISPSSENAFVYLLVFGGLTSILQAPHMLFPVAVLNDIVDYDTLKTGSSRSGNFMSVYTFFSKMLQALGFGIGYYIIALFGYDPKADEHTFIQVSGLMLAVVFVPSLCFAFSAFFLLRFPIDRKRHATIRRALDRRERRLAPET
jgi:Na+/melibiose symporter-like transporter